MIEKPKIGQIIQDDEGISWEVTDNTNSDKFLYQTQNIWKTIKEIFGLGRIDGWIPVKKVRNTQLNYNGGKDDI